MSDNGEESPSNGAAAQGSTTITSAAAAATTTTAPKTTTYVRPVIITYDTWKHDTPTFLLDQYAKLNELNRVEDIATLTNIWRQRHSVTTLSIGDVLDANLYKLLHHRLKQSPMFVLPVFKSKERGGGFFNVVLSFQGAHTVLVTALGEYQAKQQNAMPFATIVHFTEFMESKGLALMRTELKDERLINKAEAAELLTTWYQFYLTGPIYDQVVRVFNSAPQHFDFNKVMQLVDVLKGGNGTGTSTGTGTSASASASAGSTSNRQQQQQQSKQSKQNRGGSANGAGAAQVRAASPAMAFMQQQQRQQQQQQQANNANNSSNQPASSSSTTTTNSSAAKKQQ